MYKTAPESSNFDNYRIVALESYVVQYSHPHPSNIKSWASVLKIFQHARGQLTTFPIRKQKYRKERMRMCSCWAGFADGKRVCGLVSRQIWRVDFHLTRYFFWVLLNVRISFLCEISCDARSFFVWDFLRLMLFSCVPPLTWSLTFASTGQHYCDAKFFHVPSIFRNLFTNFLNI